MNTKHCTKCGDIKDISEFRKDKARKDGIGSSCKICNAAQSRQWYSSHKEERSVYASLPEVVAKRKICTKKWKHRNRKHLREYELEYRKEHLDYFRRLGRSRNNGYYAARPEEYRAKCRAAAHRRRAIKSAVGGNHTASDIHRQGKIQHWLCWWCGKKCQTKYHVDHLIPLAQGGHNDPSNIVISCPSCNLSKHDKLPCEWAEKLF